ncbi:MAG: ThuA domain-containing protein [Bryobacterales bacterium]|nr:ThuA domain-containing protein [Bryobacterales bacterium]
MWTQRTFTRRMAMAAMAGAGLLRGQPATTPDEFVTRYSSKKGPGAGKRVVLVSGDDEYRSEEALPQLGRILAARHGFTCTVLYAIDPADGLIKPDFQTNIPGLESLRDADLLVIATRFRALPDEQMRWVDEYVHSGRPIVALRTATHAFAYPKESTSPYKHWSWNDKDTWPGGFGKQVLGETWVSHHGHHAVQSTRGLVAPGQERHPVVRGCRDIWGPTDVYEVHLPADATVLVLGQVLEGMKPTDKPVVGPYATKQGQRTVVKTPNEPMMPVAWTRSFTGRSGEASRVFTTTMGAATDLESEGMRRLLVNGVYWALGMEKRIPAKADVRLVGEFLPTEFGFKKYVPGRKPADFAWAG